MNLCKVKTSMILFKIMIVAEYEPTSITKTKNVNVIWLIYEISFKRKLYLIKT